MLFILAAVPTQQEIILRGQEDGRKSWKKNDPITGGQREYLWMLYNQRKSVGSNSSTSWFKTNDVTDSRVWDSDDEEVEHLA